MGKNNEYLYKYNKYNYIFEMKYLIYVEFQKKKYLHIYLYLKNTELIFKNKSINEKKKY